MWKVTNEKNLTVMNNFEKKVIKPFFLMLWDASLQYQNQTYIINQKEDIWKTTNPYKNSDKEQKKIIDYFFQRAVKKVRFYDVFLEIVQKYDTSLILSVIKNYVRQNRYINSKKNYNIPLIVIPVEFSTVFVSFFYEKFFTLENLWLLISGEKYNRRNFHENFYQENDSIKVCPYCDISLPLAKSSNYVEHFLPKGKFPLLSMNPYNLISSCDACNKGEDGKGEDVKVDIITPYNEEIGGLIDFKLGTGVVHLKTVIGSSALDNYLDLLKMRKRYNQKKIIDYLIEETAIQMQNLGELSYVSQSQIERYLSRGDKHSSCNIAVKSIIKKYPIFKSKSLL